MDISTYALLGQLAGGTFAVFLLYALWEFLLFKRIIDDPVKGKFGAVIAAYLTASLLYGLLGANGRAFNPSGFGFYLFGAAIVGFFAVKRGMRLRDEPGRDEQIEETFG